MVPTCIECGRLGVLTPGHIAKPGKPELAGRWFYVCDCGAIAGAHRTTQTPKSLPCGPETSRARDALHRLFDPHWRVAVAAGVRQQIARDRAYSRLARALGMTDDDCHIGRFDIATCQRAAQVVAGWGPPRARPRQR